MDGLVGICQQPEVALQEVWTWTGGQPFLTQKVCKLLIENRELIVNPPVEVEEIIKSKIINNWEAQDVLEHLSTIRDRIFRKDQRIVRRLGLYQQFLQDNQTGIVAEHSWEQIELRCSGLVVKRDNKSTVASPIYSQVFHKKLIAEEL